MRGCRVSKRGDSGCECTLPWPHAPQLPGRKTLLVDPAFASIAWLVLPSGPFAVQVPEDRKIIHVAALTPDARPDVPPDGSLVFWTRPTLAAAVAVGRVLAGVASTAHRPHHTALLVSPHRSLALDAYLAETGMARELDSVLALSIACMPVDDDLVLTGAPDAAAAALLRGDPGVLVHTAAALGVLGAASGGWASVHGAGTHAAAIAAGLRMAASSNADAPGGVSGGGGGAERAPHLVILDRDVDWVGPCLTPLTFAGVAARTWPHDSAGAGLTPGPIPGKSVLLTSGTRVWRQARDVHVSALASTLRDMASALAGRYADRLALGDAAAIRSYVREAVPALQHDSAALDVLVDWAGGIGKHTESVEFRARWAAEHAAADGEDDDALADAVLDACTEGTDQWEALCVACLASQLAGGWKHKQVDAFKRAWLGGAGSEATFALAAAEAAGALRRRDVSYAGAGLAPGCNALGGRSGEAWPWGALADALGVRKGPGGGEPSDPRYVTSGVMPITVALARAALSARGWSEPSIAEALRAGVPGPHVSRGQAGAAPPGSPRRTAVLWIVGGACQAELAALRALSELGDVDWVLGSDVLVEGPRMLRMLVSG